LSRKTIKKLGLEKEFNQWIKDIKKRNYFNPGTSVKLILKDSTITRVRKGNVGIITSKKDRPMGYNVKFSNDIELTFDKTEMPKYFEVL